MMKIKVIYLIIFVSNFVVFNSAQGFVLDSLNIIDDSLLMNPKSSKRISKEDTSLIISKDSIIDIKRNEFQIEQDDILEDKYRSLEDSSFNNGLQKLINKHYQNVIDNLSIIEKNRSDSIKLTNLKNDIVSLKKIILQDSIKIFSTIEDKFSFNKTNDKIEALDKAKIVYEKLIEISKLDDEYINLSERGSQIDDKIKKLVRIKIESEKDKRKIDLSSLITDKDSIVEYQIPWNSSIYKIFIANIKKNQIKSTKDSSSNLDEWIIDKKFKSHIFRLDVKSKSVSKDEILCYLVGNFQNIESLNNNIGENKLISWFDIKNKLWISLRTPPEKFNLQNLHSLIELLGGNEFIISQPYFNQVFTEKNHNPSYGTELIKNTLDYLDDRAMRLSDLVNEISGEEIGLKLINLELNKLNAKIKIVNEELYSQIFENKIDSLSKGYMPKPSFTKFQDFLNSIKKNVSRKSKNDKQLGDKQKELDVILSLSITNKSRPNIKYIKSFENQLAKFINSKDKLPLFVSLELGNSKYRVLLIDPTKNNIHLHDNSSGKLAPLIDSWRYYLKEKKIKPLAIVNAGMYELNGSAKGLLIENKILKSQIDLVDNGPGNFYMQPNGIFYQDVNGNFGVLDTKNFDRKYSSAKDKINQKVISGINFATQSGPMLIVNNNVNPQFIFNSQNLNIRNGVGISNKWKTPLVVMAISDTRVNFYEFALLFKSIFGCENALYLDGAISKMYVKGEKNNVMNGELGPKILVTEK